MTGTVLAQAVTETGTGEAVAFWVLAPVAVLAALGMLVVRKAVHSALLLASVMVCLAIFYFGQEAPFLGVVQIIVYTGAVMMLFLFVLMLVGVDSSDSLVETIRGQRIAALLVALGFGSLLVLGLGQAVVPEVRGLAEATAPAGGNVQGIAELIFIRHVVAFEVIAALLIVATLAGMILAHRERTDARPSQRELAEARFRPGGRSSPLPPHGVYARHNAVDTPALLPDGSPAEDSVPSVLVARGDVRRTGASARDVDALERGMEHDRRGTADAPVDDPADEPPAGRPGGGT
jgi:NADH-quinone oxidoreductase subunit J